MEISRASAAVQHYDVDPAHSSVGFRVRHLGFSRVSGRFTKFDARIFFVPGDLSTLSTEVVIDASSIDTGDARRDDHLRSPDFFDIERHPHLRFASTAVRNVAGTKILLEGILTIRGIAQRVEMKGEYLGETVDPWGARRAAFEGSTRINRKDFGLNWNQELASGGFLVGNHVEISIDIQGVQRISGNGSVEEGRRAVE